MNKKVLFIIFLLLLGAFFLGYAPPSENWNQNQLEKLELRDSNNFCFAVVGDTHNNFPSVDKFLKSLDNEIEFIILNGDFINEGFNEEYHIAVRMFKKTELPLFVVIGNHEVIRDGEDMFKKIFGETYYSFNLSTTQFIFLDTSLGKIEKKQIDWLKKELNQSFDTKLVFMHYPLFNNEHHSLNEQNSELLRIVFNTGNVSSVFSGHAHNYFHYEDEGRDHVTGGSSGGMTKEIMNYVKVCVKEKRVFIEKREFLYQYRLEQLFYMGFSVVVIVIHRAFLVLIPIYLLLSFFLEEPKFKKGI